MNLNKMKNTDKAQHICNQITYIYKWEYSESVMIIRNYVQLLVIETTDSRYNSLENRLTILEFIENKFHADKNLFISFIKKVNTLEYNPAPEKLIELFLKE